MLGGQKLIAALLSGFLLWLSIFGWAQMGHGAMGEKMHYSGCVASALSRSDCPIETKANDFVAFHFESFRFFSTATFGSFDLTNLILGLLLAFGLGLILSRAPTALASAPKNLAPRSWRLFKWFGQRQLLSWLAYLEARSPRQ